MEVKALLATLILASVLVHTYEASYTDASGADCHAFHVLGARARCLQRDTGRERGTVAGRLGLFGPRDHFRAYGAWDDGEIAAWSDTDLTAMIWQEAAASMREFEDYCGSDFAQYEAACEKGTISGRLSLSEGKAWIYLGC